MAIKGKYAGATHPEFKKLNGDWAMWRLAYEGGPEFIAACLKRYSRRENFLDYRDRLELAFNSAHVTKALNRYRNAILSAMHEVKREGDKRYLDMCNTNVDLKNNSMTAFMGLQFLPLLMAQGKRFICVDAPPKDDAETKDEEPGNPWVWAVNCENVRSWSYDAKGQLKAIAILESIDSVDEETQLVNGSSQRTRYYRMVDANFKLTPDKGSTFKSVQGPGVLLRFLDNEDKDILQPIVLDLSRIPVIESRMVQALCKDIAGHAKALVNLNSTDMNFLFRGNFPIFTKQRGNGGNGIKPVNKHNAIQPGRETETMDRTVDGEDNRPSTESGTNKGQYYEMKAERPGFISPGTENVKVSMDKQAKITDDIDELLDLSLASQAKGKLMQSGSSKKADRVDLDAGLGYVGQLMETAEREVAEVVHEFMGSTAKPLVKYPTTYSIKTEEERVSDAKDLFAVASEPNEPTAQAELHKRGIELMLGTVVDSDTMDTILSAVDKKVADGEWFDLNAARALAVQADIAAGIGSKEGSCARRWLPEGEAAEAQDEASTTANALSGGPNPPMPGQPGADPKDPNDLTPDNLQGQPKAFGKNSIPVAPGGFKPQNPTTAQ